MGYLGIAMVGIAALLSADQKPASGLAGTVEAPPRATVSTPEETRPSIEKEALELRARVAQLMLVTLNGLYGPSREDKEFLRKNAPGGVVIPVIVKPQDAAEYVIALRSMPIERQSGIPLLIGANLYDLPRHERGAAGSFAQLPSLLSIAASADLTATKRLAELTANHLTTMGFNLNLGPSLELAPTLPEATGGVQHFGHDATFAAEAGRAILETLRANKILAMPMGFPGGGRNRLPKSPATLLTPRVRLAQEDLLPYARAIEQGVSLIHVANTLAPQLDAQSRPASVSSAVMRDVLRGEMKFPGVIVAGPMDSPDIERLYDPAEAAILALEAGADMLYWGEAGQKVSKAIEAIGRAVEGGRLPKARIDEALGRVLKLKKDQDLLARALPKKNKAAALGTKGVYPKEAYEIERRSITLVQNRDNVLPLSKDRSVPVGVTGVVAVDALKAALAKSLKPVVEQPIGTATHVGDIEDFEIQRLTRNSGGIRTVVCVFTHLRRTQGEERLIRAFKENGARVVVVLLGYPRDLPRLVEADAIVLAYCEESACAGSIGAAADVLLGEGPVAVLPAVRELKTKVGKPEVFNAPEVTRSPTGRLPVTLADPFVAGFALSYDTSAAIKKAEWDFGDGERSKDVRTEHAYKAPGRYSVNLTVTDKRDGVSSGAFTVVVE
jgi:beta-N-acetylhexosaminidase